ncbi:MAG: ribonuclease HII [Candidatus Altiarchaeota archaeon]
MSKDVLVCGIDEAGRGPVVGPMAVACAVFDDIGRKKLSELKVRDSKKVSPKRRTELEPQIKEIAIEWNVCLVSPSEIDRLRQKISLNVIEAQKMAELILDLECKPAKIIVDAADSIAEGFKNKILFHLNDESPEFIIPEFISEHKADDKYLEVGAASILAKVERDRQIEILKETLGDFGSGYPADELTKNWLRNIVRNGESMPDHVRRSWNTINRCKQTSLEEY